MNKRIDTMLKRIKPKPRTKNGKERKKNNEQIGKKEKIKYRRKIIRKNKKKELKNIDIDKTIRKIRKIPSKSNKTKGKRRA